MEEISSSVEETTQSTAEADRTSNISEVDNVNVLWLVSNVNQSKENEKTQEKLKKLFHDRFHTFEKPEEAINYLEDQQNQCFLLITDGKIGRQVVPKVNDLSQLKFIIIYCMNKQANEQWTKDYQKV